MPCVKVDGDGFDEYNECEVWGACDDQDCLQMKTRIHTKFVAWKAASNALSEQEALKETHQDEIANLSQQLQAIEQKIDEEEEKQQASEVTDIQEYTAILQKLKKEHAKEENCWEGVEPGSQQSLQGAASRNDVRKGFTKHDGSESKTKNCQTGLQGNESLRSKCKESLMAAKATITKLEKSLGLVKEGVDFLGRYIQTIDMTQPAQAWLDKRDRIPALMKITKSKNAATKKFLDASSSMPVAYYRHIKEGNNDYDAAMAQYLRARCLATFSPYAENKDVLRDVESNLVPGAETVMISDVSTLAILGKLEGVNDIVMAQMTTSYTKTVYDVGLRSVAPVADRRPQRIRADVAADYKSMVESTELKNFLKEQTKHTHLCVLVDKPGAAESLLWSIHHNRDMLLDKQITVEMVCTLDVPLGINKEMKEVVEKKEVTFAFPPPTNNASPFVPVILPPIFLREKTKAYFSSPTFKVTEANRTLGVDGSKTTLSLAFTKDNNGFEYLTGGVARSYAIPEAGVTPDPKVEVQWKSLTNTSRNIEIMDATFEDDSFEPVADCEVNTKIKVTVDLNGRKVIADKVVVVV